MPVERQSQQRPTSSHASECNAHCSLAFRLLGQEVTGQEALFTKLKDLVQDLQKAALVSPTSEDVHKEQLCDVSRLKHSNMSLLYSILAPGSCCPESLA